MNKYLTKIALFGFSKKEKLDKLTKEHDNKVHGHLADWYFNGADIHKELYHKHGPVIEGVDKDPKHIGAYVKEGADVLASHKKYLKPELDQMHSQYIHDAGKLGHKVTETPEAHFNRRIDEFKKMGGNHIFNTPFELPKE